MSAKLFLKVLFTCILLSMIGYTAWASMQQPVLQWRGMTQGVDRYWTIATLLDAYFGFTTFYVWVFFKERRWLARGVWLVAIMALGNMAMSVYVLIQLTRLRPDQSAAHILTSQNT